MRAGTLPYPQLEESESLSSAEIFRRVEDYLQALAAIPKKSWRPRVNEKGIRIEGPGLLRAKRLYELLRVPSEERSVVHVVGTSGKGSTALMVAASLHAAGRRTAAFFSPHMTSLAERFWLGGRFIEPRLAGRCVLRLAEAASRMAEEPGVGPPSFFESTLALFLLAAEETDCEYLILEAGLGGTFDATNAVGPAVLDIITPIGLDHTDLLGDTLSQIARDKAGIITGGGRVLSAADDRDARVEIMAAARERGAELFSLPRLEGLEWDEAGCRFDLLFDGGVRWHGLGTPMLGVHQAQNARLAAAASRLLGVGEKHVRAGLGAARLPCRLELMPGRPRVLLDGAHNGDKARALAASLARVRARRRLFLLAAVEDKGYGEMAAELAGWGDRFFITRVPDSAPRPGLPPEVFKAALEGHGARHIEVAPEPGEALDAALSGAGEDDLLVVAGSMFLAGELRRRWVDESDIVASGSAFVEDAHS